MAEKQCFDGDKVVDNASLQYAEEKMGRWCQLLPVPRPSWLSRPGLLRPRLQRIRPGGVLVYGRSGSVKGGFVPLSSALESAADP